MMSMGPSAPGMKSGGTLLTVQSVAGVYPVIDEVKLLTSVSVSRGRGSIVSEPNHFGGVKQGSYSELIRMVRVIPVLIGDFLLEPPELVLDRLKIPTFKKVIETSN